MPLSEDTKVLVRSRKKVLQTQIVSLHTLDLVQQHSLERTSSVRVPQSTIFGVGDKITASGSADEAFVPATVDNTVLFGISGDGAECRNILPTTRKALIRPSGSVSGIAIVTGSGDKSNTVLFNTSGGATDVVLVKDYENTNLFDISGGMQQGVPVYTPSWFSATGESATEEYDWGLITATPTQLSEDWGVNQYKRRDNTQGCRELGIPSRRVQLRSSWWSTLSKQRYILYWRIQSYCSDYWNNRCCNVPTFRRSRYRKLCDSIRIFWYHWYCYLQGWYQHLRCKLVQSGYQHTVFGEEGAITIGGLLLMSRSLHSFQRDLVHSSLLVVRRIQAPRHTWLETTSIFLVLRTSTSLHISLVLVLERSVKEENLIRLTLVRSIFLMMSLVEPSLLLVTPSLRRIQILTMSLLFSSVQRMKIMDSSLLRMLVVDSHLTSLGIGLTSVESLDAERYYL